MNVKILFTFQVIFIYKSYWLLIFKSEKDKSYSLIGVQGMLVVPNCWDVGTWEWVERNIESVFYEWTHLYMDLEDIMVILPYNGHFYLRIWNLTITRMDFGRRKKTLEFESEKIAINMWRRIINSSRNYIVYFLVMYKIMKCYPTLT